MADQPTQDPAAAAEGDAKPKTAKQLEKEAKKAAKLAKFAEKQAKAAEKKSDGPKQEKKPKKVEEVGVFFIYSLLVIIGFGFLPNDLMPLN